MKYIMAVDQGTTGSRAVVYDVNGTVVCSHYEEFKQYFPQPGWVEHNPREIWDSVNNAIQRVLTKVPPGSIAGIGITNQRETTILWDRRTGKPLYNAIVWQCRRTGERCVNLKSRGFTGMIRKKTGLEVDAYFSATKIEWILNHLKKQGKNVDYTNLCFGTPDTWVLYNLTGGKCHKTDYTNASRTMLYNIDKLQWDNELLKLFGVPKNILPEVQPSSSMFGVTSKNGRLPAGIPICGIAGDQQAALYGQTCFSPGTVKNTYGTGCFALMNTGAKRVISKKGLVTTLGCTSEQKAVYVLEGSVFISGAAIQWLRDGLKILEKAQDAPKMALTLKSNDGVYFVPAFVGLGTPYWNSEARGIISGLTRGTTREHIVRAAIEASCYSTRDVISTMEHESGIKIKKLNIDGGAVGDPFLCQFQADILGIKVVRPKNRELTSLGTAFLAGLYLKYWKNEAVLSRLWKKDKSFCPKMNRKTAETYYHGWKHAIAQAVV
ncbi:MAG: glycerol kinase GlpK [Elusimicrobiota bacterium]